MKRILILIITVISFQIFSQDSNMSDINSLINEIKSKYAPDKRTAIFNVTAESLEGKVVLSGETNIKAAEIELVEKLRGMTARMMNKIEVLPEKELGEKIYGIINISTANIRTGHEHSAELATQSLLGMPVKVYKKEKGWYLVQTVEEYIGWVDDDAVELMTKSEMNDWLKSEKVIFTEFYGTSVDGVGNPVSDLVKGNLLKLIGKENGKVKVEFPDKREGFIDENKSELFSNWISSIDLQKEDIVKTAFKFMGIPYLWGGTSTKGVDCSGFTKSVYYFNGIILPRDASQQVFAGEEIEIKNGFDKLEAGDLLFFGSKRDDGTEKVTHVAIYIGNNDFIHSSGMVRVNSLDKSKKNFSQYRFNTLLRAKRIIKSKEDGILVKKAEILNKIIE